MPCYLYSQRRVTCTVHGVLPVLHAVLLVQSASCYLYIQRSCYLYSQRPCYLYFYTLQHAVDYVPHAWCFVYQCLTEYLPTICHTASIWLTVGLAVHRCAAPRMHEQQVVKVI